MATSLRDFLTIENPNLDRRRLKYGNTTDVVGIVGPHKTTKWTEFRLNNLDKGVDSILTQLLGSLMQNPNVPVFDTEWCKIVEEGSVQNVVRHWNQMIVKQALENTRIALEVDQKDAPFLKGKVVFEENTGCGHFYTILHGNVQKRSLCKPDWWCFQRVKDDFNADPEEIVLLYGDSKPSKKFHSTWIESDHLAKETKALRSLEQLTKYMNAKDLQYSFIISDVELVPIRLSKRPRDMSTIHQHDTQSSTEDTAEVTMTANKMEAGAMKQMQSDTHATPLIRDVSRLLRKGSQDAYADEDRTVDIVLEWAHVPWKASGSQEMTTNLALWWLVMLATEQRKMAGSDLLDKPTDRAGEQWPSQSLDSLFSQSSTHSLVGSFSSKRSYAVADLDDRSPLDHLRRSKRIRSIRNTVRSSASVAFSTLTSPATSFRANI